MYQFRRRYAMILLSNFRIGGSLAMPFQRKRPALILSDDVRNKLVTLTSSRTASAAHIERARIMLGYADAESVSAIARRLHTNRPKVERCIDKALQLGPLAALNDLARSGKP